MSSLINKSAVRDYALSVDSAKIRGFDRVSAGFFDRIEAAVRKEIEKQVKEHPSVGKTLK